MVAENHSVKTSLRLAAQVCALALICGACALPEPYRPPAPPPTPSPGATPNLIVLAGSLAAMVVMAATTGVLPFLLQKVGDEIFINRNATRMLAGSGKAW